MKRCDRYKFEQICTPHCIQEFGPALIDGRLTMADEIP